MEAEAPAASGGPGTGATRQWVPSAGSATTLASYQRGDRSARPITMVHGFTQTGRCFGPLADELAERWSVTAVDAPGHGASVRHASADLWTGAALLPDSGAPQVLVGYSMGGRLALHAALAHPERIAALVLIGATAGLDDPEQRRRRQTADEHLASELERTGLDDFLAGWLAMPMFAGLPAWARFDEERRRNSASGLAASLRCAGTGSMEPLWDRLGEITCPVLVLAGARDAPYVELAARLERSFGGPTRRVEVAGAGHAAHLEAPGRVVEEVVAAIDRLD